MKLPVFSLIPSTLILILLLLPNLSPAQDVSFIWTASPEPVVGYKLYYETGTATAPPYDGKGLAQGDSPIDLGNVTTFTLSGLSPDQTYRFVLTTYSKTRESSYSSVVTVEPSPAIKRIYIN